MLFIPLGLDMAKTWQEQKLKHSSEAESISQDSGAKVQPIDEKEPKRLRESLIKILIANTKY